MRSLNNNNKKGMLLPLIAIGILVVAGLTPFLISNSETNALVTKSFDETNKQSWALESAVEDRLKESSKNIPDFKTKTHNKSEQEISFKYQNKADTNASLLLESKIDVKEYNTYLNKNSYFQASIKKQEQDNYNLTPLNATEVKPGISIVNNSTYVWDKYGKLYEIDNNKELKYQQVTDNNGKILKVWQIVSDGNYPIAVIASTSLSAININTKNYLESDNGFYLLAAKADTFQAGIKQTESEKANLVIPTKPTIADSFNTAHSNAKVEDISVSGNHGLAIVYDKDTEGKDTWQLWGWGNNSNGQINCIDEAPESYNDSLVNLSDNYKESPTPSEESPSVSLSAYIEQENSDTNPINAISSYFYNYYKARKDGVVYKITDPVTGVEYTHTATENNFDCTCPFCKDIADSSRPNAEKKIVSSMEISEPQELKHLEFLVDGKNSFFASKYDVDASLIICKITNEDNSINYTIVGGKVEPQNQNIYEPYGTGKIWSVSWSDESLKNAGHYYPLPVGKYTFTFEVNYNGHGNGYQNLKEDSIFWTWKDSDAENTDINSSTVYGCLFRFNDTLCNFKDKRTERSSKVNYYAVTTGNNFSLALVSPQNWTAESTTPQYSIIGWGDATLGQLGNGIGSEKEKMAPITDADFINKIKDYRDMKSGTNHTLFLTKNGEVYSWGGNSSVEGIYKIHQVQFKDSPKIIFIAAGNGKSAAIDEDGKIYEWGLAQGINEATRVNPISETPNRIFTCK